MRKRKSIRFGAVALSILLTVSLLAACGTKKGEKGQESASNTAEATTANVKESTQAEGKADISKKVEVIMYLAGDGAVDSPLVNQELSKRTEKDLNCTLKITNISWSDWNQKYPLILSSGEKYDLTYASGWAQFYDYANKGCFMAVDDLLPKYAPAVMEQLSKEALDSGRGSDGKLYGIPCKLATYNTRSYVVRGDLREKYGISPVTDFSSLEVYLEAVKTNEKDMIPFNLASDESTGFEDASGFEFIPGSKFLYAHESNLRDANIYELTSEYESFVNIMKIWNEKGYFSKSILTNKVYSYNAITEGKSAVASGNPTQIKQAIEKIMGSHPEWKPEAGSFTFKTKVGVHSVYGMKLDGMCIGKVSENPERALMVLNKLRSDRECYDILFYGIEGKNHVLTSDGMVKLPDNVTADKNGYTWGNEGQWGFRVEDFDRKSPGEWMGYYDEMLKTFKEIETPDILSRFVMNTESLANEIAALTQVLSQYSLALNWGKSDNIAKDLENLRTKLKAAGSDKYVDECKKQLNSYLDSVGYNK